MNTNEEIKLGHELLLLVIKSDPNIPEIIINKLNYTNFNEVQNKVSQLVLNYLNTIGRGLARSDVHNRYKIIKKNELNPQLLPGLFLRIPIGLENTERFKELLVNDLKLYVSSPKNIGNYCILEQKNQDVILKNIKKIQKKSSESGDKETILNSN